MTGKKPSSPREAPAARRPSPVTSVRICRGARVDDKVPPASRKARSPKRRGLRDDSRRHTPPGVWTARRRKGGRRLGPFVIISFVQAGAPRACATFQAAGRASSPTTPTPAREPVIIREQKQNFNAGAADPRRAGDAGGRRTSERAGRGRARGRGPALLGRHGRAGRHRRPSGARRARPRRRAARAGRASRERPAGLAGAATPQPGHDRRERPWPAAASRTAPRAPDVRSGRRLVRPPNKGAGGVRRPAAGYDQGGRECIRITSCEAAGGLGREPTAGRYSIEENIVW